MFKLHLVNRFGKAMHVSIDGHGVDIPADKTDLPLNVQPGRLTIQYRHDNGDLFHKQVQVITETSKSCLFGDGHRLVRESE